MAALSLPDNLKVHFAGSETMNQFCCVENMGIRYALYTAYPFVERLVFGKGKAPIMPFPFQKDDPFRKIPAYINSKMLHTIQDSGLFTLMFGAMKGKHDEAMINRWYDGLVEFTLTHAQPVTCVEVDCQKVLGVEKAWEFRERMRRDLPNNRIINVFHLEDGQKGLDRLIEFSDYIAISVPELRVLGKKKETYRLASYIKNKKPTIDIHLLGCTEKSMLKECNFCTSADSTSWTSARRFGYIDGRHISKIKSDTIIPLVGEESYNEMRKYLKADTLNATILEIHRLKHIYQQAAGNQDYTR